MPALGYRNTCVSSDTLSCPSGLFAEFPAIRLTQRSSRLGGWHDEAHACQRIDAWRHDYNRHRPHTSLDGLTPSEYHHRNENDKTLNRANL